MRVRGPSRSPGLQGTSGSPSGTELNGSQAASIPEIPRMPSLLARCDAPVTVVQRPGQSLRGSDSVGGVPSPPLPWTAAVESQKAREELGAATACRGRREPSSMACPPRQDSKKTRSLRTYLRPGLFPVKRLCASAGGFPDDADSRHRAGAKALTDFELRLTAQPGGK